MFKSIEIFAGGGGMALGATIAGTSCRLLLEKQKDACLTLEANIAMLSKGASSPNVVYGKIEDNAFDCFKGIDLLLGGPPCQPFSQGGNRKSHADSRNLFPEAIRVITECQPKAFIFENVKGLTTGRNRNFAELIRLQLQFPDYAKSIKGFEWQVQLLMLEEHLTSGTSLGLNYKVIMHAAEAADYGVPQRRERVFFVGIRQDLNCEWHFPEPTHSQEALRHSQSPQGAYWDRHQIRKADRLYYNGPVVETACGLKPWRTVRDAITDLPEPATNENDSTALQHIFVPGARVYRGHTGSPIDLPSKALKAGVHGVPGGENMLKLPDGSVRYYTIRECARIQTFPDDFVFCGSWTSQMRQIGNAVPCYLAEVVIQSVLDSLSKPKMTHETEH